MLPSRIPTAVIALLCLVLLLSPTQRAQADVPKVLNLQGYLTDAAGKPSVGNVSIRFRLYKDTTTTTHLWEETHTVALNNEGMQMDLPISVTVLLPSVQWDTRSAKWTSSAMSITSYISSILKVLGWYICPNS